MTILQTLGGIALAAALSAVIILVQKHKAKEAWAGTVVNILKHSTEDADSNIRDYITIRYIRDDGETHSYKVDAGSYGFHFKGLQPGDRLVKPAGAPMPQRVA